MLTALGWQPITSVVELREMSRASRGYRWGRYLPLHKRRDSPAGRPWSDLAALGRKAALDLNND